MFLALVVRHLILFIHFTDAFSVGLRLALAHKHSRRFSFSGFLDVLQLIKKFCVLFLLSCVITHDSDSA